MDSTSNQRARLAEAIARRPGHIFGRSELDWHANVLHHGRRKLAAIEPDALWPGMWRIRLPDGRLTDLVNISRAHDAAFTLVLGVLNQKHAEETPVEAPPIAPNDAPLRPGHGGGQMTARPARTEASAVPAIEVFRARAQARALLYQAGEFDLIEAVDVLQAAAIASGLVDELGEDAAQKIMAAEFAKVQQQ